MRKKTTTVGEFLRAYGREDLRKLINQLLADDETWSTYDTDILIQKIFENEICKNDYAIFFYHKTFIAKSDSIESPDIRPSCYKLKDLYKACDLIDSRSFKEAINKGDLEDIHIFQDFPEEYNIYLLPLDTILNANVLKDNIKLTDLEKYYEGIITAITVYTPKDRKTYECEEIVAPVFDDIFVNFLLSLCDVRTDEGRKKREDMKKVFRQRALDNIKNFIDELKNIVVKSS